MNLANKTWASPMVMNLRYKQKEDQHIFNRLFFKIWREEIGTYTNGSLFSLALIFEESFSETKSECDNMLNSYMLNNIIPGKEEHFWYLNEFIKQGNCSTITLRKRSRSTTVSSLWLCSSCQTDFATFAPIALSCFWQTMFCLLQLYILNKHEVVYM